MNVSATRLVTVIAVSFSEVPPTRFDVSMIDNMIELVKRTKTRLLIVCMRAHCNYNNIDSRYNGLVRVYISQLL